MPQSHHKLTTLERLLQQRRNLAHEVRLARPSWPRQEQTTVILDEPRDKLSAAVLNLFLAVDNPLVWYELQLLLPNGVWLCPSRAL